jgi:GNAT superfamily N-acetyltransferase
MLVRKLTSVDKHRIINNLITLQNEDRRLRFGMLCNDDYIKNYVEKSFEQDSKWFGVDHIDGHLVATCHVAIINGEAELGCCVDEDFRGEGLAQQMFDRAVTWLRTKGITNVFMHCLTENAAMRHIARKNEMTVVSCCGDTDANVEIEPPTPITFFEDKYMDRIAMYDMYYKNSYRLFDFYWNRQSHT